MKKTLTIIIVLIVIIGGWYVLAHKGSTPAYAPTDTGASSAAPMQPATATLETGSSATLGTYLTAANGMTLYKFTKDSTASSTCYGGCASVWPAYTVPAGTQPTAAAGVSGTLSTITRADGTTQITYNGMPLYFYAPDQNPGDTKGQSVGGVWFVITP